MEDNSGSASAQPESDFRNHATRQSQAEPNSGLSDVNDQVEDLTSQTQIRCQPARVMGGVKLRNAKAQYIGTTAKSQHSRSSDHQKALGSKDKKNALAKHMANTHPNQNPDFSMTTVGSQKYNLH